MNNAWNSFSRVYWWVAGIAALALLLMWFAGYGPGGHACKALGLAAAPQAELAAPAVAGGPRPGLTASPGATPAVTPGAAPAVTAAVTPATATATAPAVPAAQATAAATALPAPPPAAKLYFAVDKTELPGKAVDTLLPVVEYLKAHPQAKASVSGFHDPSGSKEHNEALAKNRAVEVRGALERAGIARERIVMQKPSETTGSGPAAEARRVEVSVQLP